MKLTSMMARIRRTDADEGHGVPQRLQEAGQRAQASTSIPGALRNLVDTATARRQAAAARGMSDGELNAMLENPGLNGRGVRTAYREALARNNATRTRDAARQSVDVTAAENEPVHAIELEVLAAPGTETPPQAVARPDGAVIHPDSGALDATRLQQTVNALVAALPDIPADIANGHPRVAALRNRLAQQLSEIGNAAEATRAHPERQHLAVRDGFARAADTSRKLARDLDSSAVKRNAGDGGAASAREYDLFSALMTELKRTHLSAAAPDLMAHYTGREAERLERVAHGIGQGVSGPNVVTSTGASLGYSNGIGNVTGSASGGHTVFSDDDRDVLFFPSAGATVQGGVGTEISGWAARINGQASYSGGGTYFEHADLKDLLALVANRDANRSAITSAGPNTRKLEHGRQRIMAAVSQLFGRNYVSEPGRPYFLADKKLEKGFNGVKLALLATELDEALHRNDDAPRFDEIIQAAYPAVGDVVRQRVADRERLPLATRRDVPVSVAYADRAVAFRNATLGVDARLGRSTGDSENIGAKGAFDLLARGELMQFFVESASAPHQILDLSHYKDLKATLAVHRQLDALCSDVPPAALELYGMTRERLQGEHGTDPLPAALAHDGALYGDEASIPSQFHDVIRHPTAAHLERAGAEAEALQQLYLTFIEDAATVLARGDRFLPRAATERLEAERGHAFARINDEIWHGRYPEADALAHPDTFVSASYASISLALGAVGTHIGIAKERLSLDASENNRAAVTRADGSYARTRELLDNVYLPMKHYDVQKNGPLEEQGKWQRWHGVVRGTAAGGATINAMGALLGHWNKSLGPVDVTNETGSLTLSAEAKFLYADHQINPIRAGKFWQITLTANGGKPLAGAALGMAVRKALNQLNEALATDEPKVDSAEIARQMQGLVFDASEGSTIVMKFRQPPELSAKSTHLQYVRVLHNQNAGLNESLTIPTPAGLFTPGISHADSSQGFVGEIMGSDLSYLILQHPRLAAVLDHPDAATPEGLKARFDANPRVRNGYFATPSTVVDTIERYAVFLDAKAQATRHGTRIEDAPKVNEFFRMLASEPFSRVADHARRTQLNAPGAAANGGWPSPDSDASWADDVDLTGIDLAAARARLAAAGSIDERTTYLCGEGRPLLDAYAKIVGNMREINAGTLFHAEPRPHGFRTVLRDTIKPLRESAAIRTAPRRDTQHDVTDPPPARLPPVDDTASVSSVARTETPAGTDTSSVPQTDTRATARDEPEQFIRDFGYLGGIIRA
ncbi:hypothetical protein [Burkholderia arboris]|uniref:hypothetical protein n=1 Tax=Burkholderia arboris TaxID=488730 RepID=UPI002109EF45|nr:hypothetical protein [Burkholderia arboris]UTV59787.1 hypothetical protein NLX30_36965 [Burkholderia arboris]